MLDIRLIREQPDFVKDGLQKVGADPAIIDEILQLDVRRREILTQVESLRAERNAVSKEIPKIKDAEERNARIAQMRQVGDQIAQLEKELEEVEQTFTARMLEVPNLPHPSVPVGKDESENVVVKYEGDLPTFEFTPKPHWELGEQLGILDFERGIKISGSRFYILKKAGAALQRALITWMLDLHTREHGYTEVYPPYLVKSECLYGTGNLPKFGDNLYHDAEEDFWLIPTAEVPVTNLHREEILEKEQLPLYYVCLHRLLPSREDVGRTRRARHQARTPVR
jgi:seryl-tRNA synthetase